MKFFSGPINSILISKDQANVLKLNKNMKSLYSEIYVYGKKGVECESDDGHSLIGLQL